MKSTGNGELISVQFPVEGMTCASCVARVEKVLNKIDGVENVTVNLATEKVSFAYNPALTNPAEAAEKVAGYGYTIKTETRTATAEEESAPASESLADKQLAKDLRLSVILSLPVFVIGMLMMLKEDFFSDPMTINKILLVLTTPVVFLPGRRFFSVFLKNLKHLSFEMNSLVAIGTGTAYGYSVFVTLFPDIAGHELAHHTYFESAAVIITLILLGKYLENRAKRRAGKEIEQLLLLRPKTAMVRREGTVKELPLNQLAEGDIVIANSGDKIAADGVIISGSGSFDESLLTGESIPVEKSKSGAVTGGSLLVNGAVEFRVLRLGDKSVLGQIIKLVEQAQGSKAPIQNLADKISAVFVPVVIGLALVVFAGWLLMGASLTDALVNFVAVLVIACPCAMGLATPTAIMVGIGNGAKRGIIIKDGESLERAGKISVFVFDKTGTITQGTPRVVEAYNHLTQNELQLLSSALAKSTHPLAGAVRNTTGEASPIQPSAVNNIPGKGVIVTFPEALVVFGSKELISGYASPELINSVPVTNEAGSEVWCLIGSSVARFILRDTLRPGTLEAIASLKAMGITPVMATGDNHANAALTAREAGIDEFYAGLLPADKAELIKKYKAQGKVTGMAGDGINDAPALAEADLSISPGTGSDMAIETSGITLLNGDIAAVVSAIRLSGGTVRIIKQNLFWAFIYNIIGIPLAAAGILNPMFSALAMSFSSVSVVTNSLRLRFLR